MSAEPTGEATPRTAQVAFDEFLRLHVRPALSALGFRRTRGTFHRAAGANWEVIDFQRSYYSDRQQVRFAVNLAIGFESLRAAEDGWPAGKRPAEFRCHLRQRLNTLALEWDFWWERGPSDPLEPLAVEVLDRIEAIGLPWLDARSDEIRWRDACLASLQTVQLSEFRTLQQLVELFGPPEAVHLIEAERARRP